MSAKKDNAISNYIPISRGIKDNWLWEEDRERTLFEAWFWMIMEARFDVLPTKKLIGGKILEWGRGQFPGSVRFLATAWKWKSKGKVQRFLDRLVEDDMISIEIRNGQQLITLTNYEKFNFIFSEKQNLNGHSKRDSKKMAKILDSKGFEHNPIMENGTPNGTPNGTGARRGRDETNNVNKEKKEKNVSTPAGHLLNGFSNNNQHNIPKFDQVHENFIRKGGTEKMAQRFFDSHESTGWLLRGSPIINWISLIDSFIDNWTLNEKKNSKTEINAGNNKPREEKSEALLASVN